MRTYRKQPISVECVYRKSGTSLLEMDEVSGIPHSLIRAASKEIQSLTPPVGEYITALQIRNTELKEYAHMVAHDLKDPLTVLITTSDLINHIPELSRKELQEYLWQIRSTAYEMTKIINNLLLLAEVNKAEAPQELINMGWVVMSVRDRLKLIIKEHRAQIHIPQVWPEAIGYAPWIEEVWANYLSNALKYGGRPPHVELGASPQSDGMIRFWVHDNGPGLPAESQTNLFSSFSQINRLAPGHGLGLSIVSQIVEKLGGQAGVESELGKGSLFFFTLPSSPLAS